MKRRKKRKKVVPHGKPVRAVSEKVSVAVKPHGYGPDPRLGATMAPKPRKPAPRTANGFVLQSADSADDPYDGS